MKTKFKLFGILFSAIIFPTLIGSIFLNNLWGLK